MIDSYTFSYAAFPVILAGVFMSWKDHNIRWLLLIMLVVEAIEELTLTTAVSWGHSLYMLWCMFIGVVFIGAVLLRRYIAERLSNTCLISANLFFRRAVRSYEFMGREGFIIGYYALSVMLAFVCLVEGFLYSNWLIDSFPIKNYAYPVIQHFLHALMMLSVIYLAGNAYMENKGTK